MPRYVSIQRYINTHYPPEGRPDPRTVRARAERDELEYHVVIRPPCSQDGRRRFEIDLDRPKAPRAQTTLEAEATTVAARVLAKMGLVSA